MNPYPKERFLKAMQCLISSGPMNERIKYALHEGASLNPEFFPEHIQPKYHKLMSRFKGLRAFDKNEGTIDAYSKNISETDAEILAMLIFDIYNDLLLESAKNT